MSTKAFPTPEQVAALDPETLAQLLTSIEGTLGRKMGIVVRYASPSKVVATMPTEGNRQPTGRVHGGANVAIAEEVASIGTALNLDFNTHIAVGVDINATHVRGVTEGLVTATAECVHKGRSLMVWNITLQDEQGRTTCVARCSCAIISR